MGGRIGSHLALGALGLVAAALPPGGVAHASRLYEVVAEGDVLLDGTIVQTIDSSCGSNRSYRSCIAIVGGQRVVFYGTTSAGVAAIFTQRGDLVEDGGMLPDGSIPSIEAGSIVGGLSSDGGARLAFPALDGSARALFTPFGLVVAQGDTLPDGTAASINFQGGVAINAIDDVAFHGSNAVFTQNGRVARAHDTLPDGTVVGGISFFGGVATNGRSERVAFHGFTDNRQAIFTQDGVVVEVGLLPDGTVLDSIDLFGRLALSHRGQVVFHGRTAGHDAVLSQDGVIARTGDALPDGTVLDAILPEGGVAINHDGIVVFHGETGGRRAVFTQHGLLVEEGDALPDGTRLDRIRTAGGVAIDYRGYVVFHGETGGRGAVFVARSSTSTGRRHRHRHW